MASEVHKIQVTHVEDPHDFYARIGTEESLNEFDDFERRITAYCVEHSARSNIYHLKPKQCVFAQFKNGGWLRGIVSMLVGEEVDVIATDYKFSEFLSSDDIIDDIPKEFSKAVLRVWKCRLHGIQPIARKWISRSVEEFERIVDKQVCDVQIIDFDNRANCFTVDILIEESETCMRSLSEIMVDKGLAMPAENATLPTNIPKFDVQMLSRTVESPVDLDKSTEEINFEQEIFLQGIERSNSDHIDEEYFADYGRNSPSRFPSIKEQLTELRGSTTQSEESSAASTPNRPTRQQNRKQYHKKINSDTLEVEFDRRSGSGNSRTGSGHRTGSDSQSGSSHRNDGLGQNVKSGEGRSRGRGSRRKTDTKEVGARSHRVDRVSPQPIQGDAQASDDLQKYVKPLKTEKSTVNYHHAPQLKTVKDKKKSSKPENDISEYSRSKTTFQREVFEKLKLLQLADVSDYSNIIDSLHAITFPLQSTLMSIPGLKELPLLMEVLIEDAVKCPTSHSGIVRVIHSFWDTKDFIDLLCEKLWFYHDIYVKDGTNRNESSVFCHLLGQLFIEAQCWEKSTDRESDINFCINPMIEQWRKMISEHEAADMVEKYTGCFLAFFTVAGRHYAEYKPAQCEAVFSTVLAVLLHTEHTGNLRQSLHDLLVMRVRWESPAAVSVDSKQCSSSCKQTQCGSETEDCQVQVNLQDSRPSVFYSQSDVMEQIQPISIDVTDNLWKLKVMLTELSMESFLETFKENAVIDELLDADFKELKDLLKEIGLKPGHITRIKLYLHKTDVRVSAETRALGHAQSTNTRTSSSNGHQHRQSHGNKHRSKMAASIHQVTAPVLDESPYHFQPVSPSTSHEIKKDSSERINELMSERLTLKTPSEFLSCNGQRSAGTEKLENSQDTFETSCEYSQPDYLRMDYPIERKNYETTFKLGNEIQEETGLKLMKNKNMVNDATGPSVLKEDQVIHPCTKYNLKAVKGVVINYLSDERKGIAAVSGEISESENFVPSLNLEEFPELTAAESGSLQRSYLPPPPVDQFKTPMLDSVEMEKKDVSEADAQQMKPAYSEVKTEKNVKSLFGKNRLCTVCGSSSHIVDDCPNKIEKLFM